MNRYENPRTEAFRATLDRLPDEIALAIGLRVFDETTLGHSSTCVCGWALREAIARELGVDPDETAPPDSIWHTEQGLVERFGGNTDEWDRLLMGVIERPEIPLIEEALFDRVMAAATSKKRSKRVAEGSASQ